MLRRTKAEDDLLFQVLQKAKNRLEYLTPNDWALIVDKSKTKSFKANEALIEPGKPRGMVYLLVKGNARIESNAKVRISQIGPGEVCGEMSFLENQLASAWVIAEDAVEAYAIDWGTLHEVFELYPHLASRFYRSLAVNLSRRLRDQIGPKK
jgi:CRP/FNR family cyclic AMP-dependent transcriptional regulator